jgi:predicted RNA binding protein YcfA (HicA-like mRNA interferase family)
MGISIRYKKLYRLLIKDGWIETDHGNHGKFLYKEFEDGKRTTVVKNTKDYIKTGTLMRILGPRETGLGKKWLEEKLDKKKK